MNHPFKLKSAALMMALSAIYPLVAHSAAGVAQFAIGDVNVRRGATSSPLAKGQVINPGDNIVTGTAGQTQIRFTDGGLVSLAPNSQFNIDKYVDENDVAKDGFAVSFLRGGMRAITGLIGKRNRENYKVTTSTATVGIRGSAFSSTINPDGTMDVADEQDGIVVCTNAGCVELIVGEVVRVTDANSLPRRTVLRSNVPPLVARQDLFVSENPIRVAPIELPRPQVVPPVPPVPPVEPPTQINGVLTGVSALFGFGSSGFTDHYPRGGQDPSNGQGTFVDGQMTKHVGTADARVLDSKEVIAALVASGSLGSVTTVEKTSPGAGSFGTVGGATDPGFIGWGYWDTGKSTGSQLIAQLVTGPSEFSGVHYIVGRPTPQAQMPATGSSSYSLVGGTSPTAWDGSTLRVGSLIGASLNVDFSASLVNAVVDTRFSVAGKPLPVQISGYGFVDGSTFYANGNFGDVISGFFTSDKASRAGLLYSTHNDTIGDVLGAAVLRKSGPGEAYTTQSGMAGMFVTSSSEGRSFDSLATGGAVPSPGSGRFVGKQLVFHDDGADSLVCCGNNTLWTANSPVSSFGSLGNVADADFVGWGYWAKGKQSSAYGGGSSFIGVHYLVGRPTLSSQMPVTGTAKYNLAGGTAPTAYDSDSGTLLTGQLMSAGLNVDFSFGGVNTFINTQFTKTGGAVVPVQIGGVGTISGSFFRSDGNGIGSYSGFFVGNGASRAGLIYQYQNSPVGDVQGAAAFEKAAGAGDAFTFPLSVGAMFASGDGAIFDLLPRGGSDPYGGTSKFIGNQLIYHDDRGDSHLGSSTKLQALSPVNNSGSLGNVVDADFIGWGYWTKGRQTTTSGYGGSSSLSDVHYLVGRPTPTGQMPVTGTATYTLAGGTTPTATLGGTTIFGSLVPGDSGMSVNFGTRQVDATIATQFTKNGTVNVTVRDTAFISGSSFISAGCGSGKVNGFFTGNQAARAGLIYSKTDSTIGLVRGAAVFQKAVAP